MEGGRETANAASDRPDASFSFAQDLTDPSNIDKVFSEVVTRFGPVSTVIYNGSSCPPFPSHCTLTLFPFFFRSPPSLFLQPTPFTLPPAGELTPPPIRTSPFSLPLASITPKHTPSLYRAAQLLLEQPKSDTPRVFINTGNILHLPGHIWLVGFAQALDKGASAKVIEYGARAYGAKDEAYCERRVLPFCSLSFSSCSLKLNLSLSRLPFPFPVYNAFQSTASGGVPPIASLSAESHGDICLQLAQTTKQEAFDVPFYWDAEAGRAERVGKGVELESESAWFAGK